MPKMNSKQHVISFTFQGKIMEGVNVILKDEDGQVVFDFEAEAEFRTLILSSNKLEQGIYSLEIDGREVEIAGKKQFAVEDLVTSFK